MDRGAWRAKSMGSQSDTTEQLTRSLSSTLENIIPQSHRNCSRFQWRSTRECAVAGAGEAGVARDSACWLVRRQPGQCWQRLPVLGVLRVSEQQGSCMSTPRVQPTSQTPKCKEGLPTIYTAIELSFQKASLTMIHESKYWYTVLTKIQNLLLKGHHWKMEKQATDLEKILWNRIFDKTLISWHRPLQISNMKATQF